MFFAGTLSSAEKPELPKRMEVVRFEMASVIGVSAAVSQLGNCIAPNFKDSVALFTVALTVGGTAFGMDPTRPVSIVFYKVGDKPSMQITAYAIPDVRVIKDKVTLWNMKFHARLEKGLVTLSTEDLLSDPVPVSAPGKRLSGSLLVMEAFPDKIDFLFTSLDDKKKSHGILFRALDELMCEVDVLRLSFRTDDNSLVIKLSVQARKNSALESYLSKPLPEKGAIETYAGASSLLLFRLPPSESLYRHGEAYFFRNRQNALLPLLPSAVTGFAVLCFERDIVQSSAKLMLGIRPEQVSGIASTASGLGYTPYPNLFQVTKNPPLFCSASGKRLVFYYTSALEKDSLEDLLKPIPLSLDAGESPFAFYDLSHPDRPIADLRFKGNTAEMIFRAPAEWFASLSPLLNVPLHKIGLPSNLRNETAEEY